MLSWFRPKTEVQDVPVASAVANEPLPDRYELKGEIEPGWRLIVPIYLNASRSYNDVAVTDEAGWAEGTGSTFDEALDNYKDNLLEFYQEGEADVLEFPDDERSAAMFSRMSAIIHRMPNYAVATTEGETDVEPDFIWTPLEVDLDPVEAAVLNCYAEAFESSPYAGLSAAIGLLRTALNAVATDKRLVVIDSDENTEDVEW